MKKKVMLWSVMALILAVGIFFLTGYLLSRMKDGSVEEATLQLEPLNIVPGGTSTAEITLHLPLFADLPDVTFESPSGMVQSGTAKWKKQYRWKENLWKMRQSFRAMEPGTGSGGSATLIQEGKDPIALQFPVVTVEKIDAAQGDLDIAGALPLQEDLPVWYGWIGGAVLLLAIVLLWWWKMRKSRSMEPPLPPWVRAEHALSELQTGVETGNIGLEKGFLRLTDLLRIYLEERFQMPARKRTSEEFLEDLRSDSNPLPPEEKPFLRDFITASELVKFAKQPPDRHLLLRALDGAKQLVIRTVPAEENREGKDV